MTNLFIAGVGNVELFKGSDSVLVSKTLVDSSINLSVSLEDIRAGAGAKLYGKYAHSSTMTMKLTDAMFRMEFLAANIGADISMDGTAVAVASIKATTGGVLDIKDLNPQPLYEGGDTLVWVSKKGEEDYKPYAYADTIALENGVAGADYCVRYIKDYEVGETLKVSANFIPDTMTAILTAPLFAGDNSNLEVSTKVGTLTITIPRFMLNGTTDLTMNMTGASQMALEGSALAVNDADCENNDGYYAIISKVLTNEKWYDNIEAIFVEDEHKDYATPVAVRVYAKYKNGNVKLLSPDKIVIYNEQGEEAEGYNTTTGMFSHGTNSGADFVVKLSGDGVPALTANFSIDAE